MYSIFKNILIYREQFDIEYCSGEFVTMKLKEPFSPIVNIEESIESCDGRYVVNYEHRWITIFDRIAKKYHKIYAPREFILLVNKFTMRKELPFELQYCKHLRGKYSKNCMDIFFSTKIENEVEVIDFLREAVAPDHSTGQDNQPCAIVYFHGSGSIYAHVVKCNRLVANVHIPCARRKS